MNKDIMGLTPEERKFLLSNNRLSSSKNKQNFYEMIANKIIRINKKNVE